MSQTVDFDSDEAIIYLNPERTRAAVDPVKYVIGYIRKNWDAKNTDGDVPEVVFPEENTNAHRQDFIKVYSQTAFHKYAALGFQFRNSTYVINIELVTWRSREHSIKAYWELRRVMDEIRKDSFGTVGAIPLTGRHWSELIRETPMVTSDKLTWRRSLDFDFRTRYEEVQT